MCRLPKMYSELQAEALAATSEATVGEYTEVAHDRVVARPNSGFIHRARGGGCLWVIKPSCFLRLPSEPAVALTSGDRGYRQEVLLTLLTPTVPSRSSEAATCLTAGRAQ